MHVWLPTSSRCGRGAEQAGRDITDHTNRIDDLARAHTLGGTPRHKGEAIAVAQRNLTAVTHHHDQHVTTHAAHGHLHQLAANLVTLDKAQRTLQQGIWDIAAARRARHDPAKGLWNGYDEQRATADLTPVLTAAAPRPSRRTAPSTLTGHDQATAAALRPRPCRSRQDGRCLTGLSRQACSQ
ncbi:hypothetical protein [Streptomyces flaveolus]|uniref:hypothetical protein n=1 Tax=Streptomyces flaveolus TaxID=67297 RepID=UPI0036F7DB1B